jgi:putative OPT family oligopeptide transporter
LAQGVLGGTLRWDLIGFGALIAVAGIAIDELVLARRAGVRLPPLGVAMGMYLPMSVTLFTVVGAVIGHLWDKRAERSHRAEFLKRSGVLLATGIIVGDSLFGLFFAGTVAGLGDDALAIVGPGFAHTAEWLGLAVFFGLLWWAYRRTHRLAEATP